MANKMMREITEKIPGLDGDSPDAPLDEPLPSADDPGGAHAKGFSADPRPGEDVKDEGPVPLEPGHDTGTAVHQPEREGKVQPTGRAEPRDYTPNDRLMGSDR